MAKYVIIAVCVLISCGEKNNQAVEINFNDLEIVKNVVIPDSLGLTVYITGLKFIEHGIVFVDVFGNKIIKYDNDRSRFVQLSRSGNGPGEYFQVSDLYVNKDTILFSDSKPYLTAISLSGQFIRSVPVGKYAGVSYIQFINDAPIVLSNMVDSKIWLKTPNETILKRDKFFDDIQIGFPFVGFEVFNSSAYFMTGWEHYLYRVDLNNFKMESVEIDYFKHEGSLRKISGSRLSDIDAKENETKFPSFHTFFAINDNNYFAKGQKNEKQFAVIFDVNGHCSKYISFQSLYFVKAVGVENDMIIFVKQYPDKDWEFVWAKIK